MSPKLAVRPVQDRELTIGETIEVPVEIERNDCDDSVMFRLENLPQGVRMTEQCRIHRGETYGTCRLEALPNARVSAEQEVRVTASAPGVSANGSVRIAVTSKGAGGSPSKEPANAWDGESRPKCSTTSAQSVVGSSCALPRQSASIPVPSDEEKSECCSQESKGGSGGSTSSQPTESEENQTPQPPQGPKPEQYEAATEHDDEDVEESGEIDEISR